MAVLVCIFSVQNGSGVRIKDHCSVASAAGITRLGQRKRTLKARPSERNYRKTPKQTPKSLLPLPNFRARACFCSLGPMVARSCVPPGPAPFQAE